MKFYAWIVAECDHPFRGAPVEIKGWWDGDEIALGNESRPKDSCALLIGSEDINGIVDALRKDDIIAKRLTCVWE